MPFCFLENIDTIPFCISYLNINFLCYGYKYTPYRSYNWSYRNRVFYLWEKSTDDNADGLWCMTLYLSLYFR